MDMVLSEADRIHFFSLWLGLLDYVNRKYNTAPLLSEISTKVSLPVKEIIKVADHLWENPSEIDHYLDENIQLSAEDLEIVRGWKRFVRGDFIIERHLKKGSVFISSKTQKVYLVKGITDPWEKLLRREQMPVMVKVTLMPYRDVIVSDGLVRPYDLYFGGGLKQELKEIYMMAKNSGEIIQFL